MKETVGEKSTTKCARFPILVDSIVKRAVGEEKWVLKSKTIRKGKFTRYPFARSKVEVTDWNLSN